MLSLTHIKNANASQLAKDKAILHLAEEGVSFSFQLQIAVKML